MAEIIPTPKDYQVARRICPGIDFTPSLHADTTTHDLAGGGGCPQCIAAAKVIAEVRQSAADADPRASQLRQAIGLMTTAKPDMDVDIENPVAMAREIVAQAERQRTALTVLAMRLRTVDPAWKHYSPAVEKLLDGYRSLFDAVQVSGVPA